MCIFEIVCFFVLDVIFDSLLLLCSTMVYSFGPLVCNWDIGVFSVAYLNPFGVLQ